MILALKLLLMSQGGAKPSVLSFEETLQRANRAWYELPRSTTTLRFLDKDGKEAAAMSESRDGERYIFRATKGTEPVFEIRSNGSQVVFQNFLAHEYTVEPAAPRAPWTSPERAATEKTAAPDPDAATLSLKQGEGLVLQVVGATFQPGLERAGEVDGKKVRLLASEMVKSSPDGGEIRMRIGAVLDREKGFFRRATFIVTRSGEPDETTIVWTCDDGPPKATDYDVDLTRLAGWTKVVGNGLTRR